VSADERLVWAKKLFKEASAAHEAEDFFNSVVKFEQAYSFAPDKHIFAFNIGQDAWELKDCARVKQYLELFLIKETSTDEKKQALRKQAQELLAKAENNKECVTGGPAPTPTTTNNNQPRGPAEDSEDPLLKPKRGGGSDDTETDEPKKRGASGLLIGGVVLAVLGVGAAGGGIGTLVVAKGKAGGIEDTANSTGSTKFAQGQYDSGVAGDFKSLKTMNLMTPLLLSLGGAMLVGGIVMIVIDRGNKKNGKGFYARQSGVQFAGMGAAPLPGGGAAGSFALRF
jgi:hypothetical protein